MMPFMLRSLALVVASLVLASTAVLHAQTQPNFVLTALAGNPASQVLKIDPVTGGMQSIGGFQSDNLSPLALAQDPFDGDLLVALDEGTGSSRIIRLHRFAGTYLEFPLATVPGRVVDLAVVGDVVLIAVDDAAGGVYRAPRRGGAPTFALAQSNLTAMTTFGYDGLALAWTGRAGTSVVDSGVGVMSATQLQWWFGPFTFANPTGRETTGVLDLATALPRQFLAFDDGSMEVFSGLGGTSGQPLVFSPPLPVGAATAVHSRGPNSFDPVVLGNAAYPFLYVVNHWTSAILPLSLALPGSPVDFAYGIQAHAHAIAYGAACGSESLDQRVLAPAQVGSMMSVAVDGAPLLPVLFVAGLDDFALGQLPVALPGGCALEVTPDVVLLDFTSSLGTATKVINVPALPGLLGTVVHTQWAHFDPAGISVSAAMANWIGL